VKLLLDLGAHANYTKSFSPDSDHKPILVALSKCSSISNGIVKLLVERGANVNSEEVLHGFIESSNQCTFSNEETAKLFFDHGANFRVWDYIGKTALNRNNKKALIELLVASSLTLGKVDGWGREVLDALVTKKVSIGRAEQLRQLLDLDAHIIYRITAGPALLQSVLSDDTESYGCDLDEPHEPCFSFIYNTVKHLLGYGAYGTIGDSEGETPIHKTDSKRLIQLLLAHGEKLNTVDSYGQTPLHAMTYGASKAMVKSIKLLLKHGADITAKNADDNTPLHLAVLTSEWEVVKLLIDHGADRGARNSGGETPMDLLSRRRSHREQFAFNRNKREI
jgi:ankyrin repeat protein